MDDGSPAPTRTRRPRLTIRLVMVAIVVSAIDLAFAKTMSHVDSNEGWSFFALLVVAYDALAVFTYLAVRKMIHPGPEDRKYFWVTAILGVVVLAACAGLPLLVAIRVLLVGRW